MPWSTRTRCVKFKYTNSNFSKNNLIKQIEKDLKENLNYKMGLIAENHELLDPDQLNQEREKRLMSNITQEVFKL